MACRNGVRSEIPYNWKQAFASYTVHPAYIGSLLLRLKLFTATLNDFDLYLADTDLGHSSGQNLEKSETKQVRKWIFAWR